MTDVVAVTGAAGFIGRWTVAELLERGCTVHGLDDMSRGSYDNVEGFLEDERFTLSEGDVRNESAIDEIIDDDTDAVIHLAAEIDVHESLEDPRSHFQTNVVGTEGVLEACRRHGCRLTLVGTCMVYDMIEAGEGIDETHPVEPASPYAGSKLAAENLAESYFHGYDLPVTILRPFNTYGPYQRAGSAGGVVPIFVERDLRGKPLKIYGDGSQTRDLMYASDCARFIVDATFADEAVGEVLNAGTGTDVSISELADLVASPTTDVEYVEHHHPQSEIQRLRCDPGKVKEFLDWEPQVPLEEGIRRVRNWMQNRAASDEDA